jgi:hypothetical protein
VIELVSFLSILSLRVFNYLKICFLEQNAMEQNKNSATRPSWYTQGRVESIEAMESAFSGEDVATFCRLNAFKYVWRSTAHKDSENVNVRKAI